jgi:hypothetical protein
MYGEIELVDWMERYEETLWPQSVGTLPIIGRRHSPPSLGKADGDDPLQCGDRQDGNLGYDDRGSPLYQDVQSPLSL